MEYCETMFESIKIYTKDKCWNHILTDLGANIVESQNIADVIFDDIDIKAPISVLDLKNILFGLADNAEIIKTVFKENIILPALQHKIIVLLYKNQEMTMRDLKNALGLSPSITTHSVETAIYQLRKNYGHDFIKNIDGKYRIGQL